MESHLHHAAGFADALEGLDQPGQGWSPARAADLGSGAGLPGLPLALRFAGCGWVLVESSARRTMFLREAVDKLGLEGRVEVVHDRAEVVGRSPAFRASFDLVVARALGRPPVFAECAGPLLRVGGRGVVSEPPGGDPGRWPVDGLGKLGMTPGPAVTARGSAFQVLVQDGLCPVRYPRRVGVPAKRPLF